MQSSTIIEEIALDATVVGDVPEDLFTLWMDRLYVPVAGAEGDDDNADADADADADAGDTDDDADADADADGDEDDDDSAATSELEKKVADLTTALDKAEAAARKAKKEAADERKRKAAAGGDHEGMARQLTAENEDLVTERDGLVVERDTAVAELDDYRREVRVVRLAAKIGYRDPADAIALIKREDTDDDKSAERALRKLAVDKKYLVDERKATGRGMNGGAGGSNLFTKEQLAAMSDTEINANWEKVQASMTANSG